MASRCVTKGLLVSGTMALVCAIPICAASTVLPEPTPGLLAFTAGPIGADTPVLPPREIGASPVWHVGWQEAGDYYGYSVATAGDVNGDGYSDVIVGARNYSNPQTYEGAAFLYLGSAGGLSTTPAWSYESNQIGAGFGVCVAPAGDVNNDGYDDVIIGADTYDIGQSEEGCAFVFLGSSTGLAVDAGLDRAERPGRSAVRPLRRHRRRRQRRRVRRRPDRRAVLRRQPHERRAGIPLLRRGLRRGSRLRLGDRFDPGCGTARSLGRHRRRRERRRLRGHHHRGGPL